MGTELTSYRELELTELIKRLVGEIKYGNITLIIQGGKVIQVDKNEKIRL